MIILVTGATGFIGGAVVKKLLQDRYKVRILVRCKKGLKMSKKVEICEGDLRDYKSIEKAVSNVSVVINCAAILPHHKLDVKDYWDINALGVQNIVNACISSKVNRLIHISTVGIYGPTLNKNISEKSKPSPEDVYAKSKLEAEKFINKSSFNTSSVIIRPTIAYGPGDVRPVFLRLFKMTKSGINIVIGGGGNYFHTVYIDNLVNVIIKTIHLKTVSGKDFIVGDVVCPTMIDIQKEIISVQNRRCFKVCVPKNIAVIVGKIFNIEKTVRFVSENRKYNINKLKKYFDIKSNIGISIGIKRTYNWYKKNNLI